MIYKNNLEVIYGTIRQKINQTVNGITEEQANKCQEEFAKIKVSPIDFCYDEDIPSYEQSEEKDKGGLKSYQIALIIIGSVIFLILIILLVLVIKSKRAVTNKQIKDQVNNMNEGILEWNIKNKKLENIIMTPNIKNKI